MMSVNSYQSSRDPAGVDPSGVDILTGADPPPDEHRDGLEDDPPILPPRSPAGPPPPTPRRTAQYHNGIRAPSPVMALLVGTPPPPPPTPPPQRNRSMTPSSRRRSGPISPPGDSSGTGHTSPSPSFQHQHHQLHHHHHTGKMEPREREPTESTTARFLDQKRREALAIYESPSLYCDEDAPEFLQTGLEPQKNAPMMVQSYAEEDNSNSSNGQLISLVSPRSAATEPHSNRRTVARRNSKRSNQESQLDYSSAQEGSSKSKLGRKGSAQKKRRGRTSTSNSKGRKTRSRSRSKSLERAISNKTAETPDREKRGFLSKIFRGGKRRTSDATVEKAEESQEGYRKVKSAPSRKTDILPPRGASDGTDAPAQRVAFLNGTGRSDVQDNRASSLEVDTSQNDRNDIPSDAQEELDLGLALDTVTSGLTNDMEPDRREIFFAHDEVSTLTAPSAHSHGRRNVDPVETSATVTSCQTSEPIGHYWNGANRDGTSEATPKVGSPTIDPFSEPFFQEPDGESPITSKKVKAKSSLQVQVPQSRDPTGETPQAKHSLTHTNEPSPRGWESPITELRDPLGSTVSESNSRRSVPGFGRPESQQQRKLPPSQRSLPHELRREPSAFRDGSPYTLDPPLRSFSKDQEESKERREVKPEQPPHVTPLSTRGLEVGKKDQKAEQRPPSSRGEESTGSRLDKPSPPTTSLNTDPEKTTKSMNAESPDAAGFLDELFQEKPTSVPKRPSIVRPISINISESAANASSAVKEGGPSRANSQTQVIEIHRTQRLSKSPRKESSGVLWGQQKLPPSEEQTSSREQSVSPTAGQTHSTNTSPDSKQKRKKTGEEEKKEQEHNNAYAVAHSSSSKGTLATSISALSAAACMNAKTVAYLHTLNGEPSPRHTWRRPDLSDDEYSPVNSDPQSKALSNVKPAVPKKRVIPIVCRSDEAAFDSFISSGPTRSSPSTKSRQGGRVNSSVASSGSARVPLTAKAGQNQANVFSATKPGKGKPGIQGTVKRDNNKAQVHSKYGALSPRSRKHARENFRRPLYYFRFNRDVRVTGLPLTVGLDLQRRKREEDILNGLVTPARNTNVIKKKKKPAPSTFQALKDEDIKDPIQRAGRRLLTKAAIPIQSSARGYLARREALQRMQANIIIQSYFRRWSCEAFLRAYKHECTKIQSAFRSWLVRDEIALKHYHATQIQKVVRGYIAAAYVYDTLYWVSRLQATFRGKLYRLRYARLRKLRQSSALKLQAWYRGCLVRQETTVSKEAIVTIQATFRKYLTRIHYQSAIVEIVRAQSLSRQYLARNEVQRRRLVNMNKAACKIQATWRGFQGYTDYIFALVDILVLQRSMRKWSAMNKVNSMRRTRAAIKIQAQWRRQTALIGMLYDLVHIIIVQSVIRRFLTQRKVVPQKRLEYSRRMHQQQKLDSAATKIQTAWRGFWGYSHYIIMQYEIIRLQAIIRGRASRILFSLKLGCCIMIQSSARRFLANKKAFNLKLDRATLGAQVEGLRTKFACRRIQFWWRVVMECSKEKHAALVIERFFLMVKTEVDKEITRQRQIQAIEEREIQTKLSKRSKAPPRIKEKKGGKEDETLLERVWMNTVDDDKVEIYASTSPKVGATTRQNGTGGRSQSAPRLHQNPSYISEPSREDASFHGSSPSRVKHHPSSPTNALVMRHEQDPAKRREMEMGARKEEALKASRRIRQKSKPPPDVTLTRSDERTEVSAITSPTVFKVGGSRSRAKKAAEKQRKLDGNYLSPDGTLYGEELVGSKSHSGTNKRRQSSETRKGQKHHFFSEDATKNHKGDRRRHSTSSIASEDDASLIASDFSGKYSHLYSRTATTHSRTTATQAETMDSGASLRSGDADMRQTVMNEGMSSCASVSLDRRYGADKYSTNSSAASKGQRLLQQVKVSSNPGSPRHGRITVTNTCSDYPILSQDSRDNVEVEYAGDQFGMI